MTTKVIFIDSWTRGIHNFIPVHRGLAAQGVESLLIHLGSWGSEPGRPFEEEIDGIRCRDIQFYGTNLFYEVFKRERADAVLMLNSNYVANRGMILAARKLGVQTTYLMHGLLDIDPKLEVWEKSVGKQMREIRWQRVGKYARFVLPNYFYSGIRNDPLFALRSGPYRVLWDTFRQPQRYLFYPNPSTELQCDRALVWANVYGRHMCKVFGYPEEQVRVVGHPPLDAAFHRRAHPPSQDDRARLLAELQLAPAQRYCVLLETPFVEEGFAGWTPTRRESHYAQLAQIAQQAGLALVIKLHPSSTFPDGGFSGAPLIRVRRQADLPRLLDYADAAIGYMSTTIMTAIALGTPVYCPAWAHPMDGFDFFAKHGVMKSCATPADLVAGLARGRAEIADQGDRARFVEDFITFTDGRSVERIIENILDQIAITAGRVTNRKRV